ncbi:hypothetical protein [Sedimentitalea todarodis]|uniref:Uncharacterized protein n=1 Tax=Sedimentitalea todarodis TaxID=1631240 RepID=A0ABU3VL13_9RHOB|nr:hypothetical protein [Sedimentitalea todarodis]MDU9006887.1 hypothetical protein [Sedimentitalea todarodis]
MTFSKPYDLDRILNQCLGATPRLSLEVGPGAGRALRLAILFFAAFVLLPLGIGLVRDDNPDLTLISLSAWGTAYLFFAAWTAKNASFRVAQDFAALWPYIETTDWIEEAIEEIEREFRGPRTEFIAVAAVLIGLVLTVLALAVDLGYLGLHWGWAHPQGAFSLGILGLTLERPDILYWEWVIFGSSYAVLYYVSARTTFVATFLISITKRLEPKNLHEHYDPWQAPTVCYCLDMSRTILLFWAGISLSVATLPLIFGTLEHFLQIVVSTAMFFSLIIGTTVFILSEQQIRRAARIAVIEKLETLSRDLSCLRRADAASENKYEMLKDQFTRLSGAKASTSYVIVILSLTLPLLGTLVKIIVEWAT